MLHGPSFGMGKIGCYLRVGQGIAILLPRSRPESAVLLASIDFSSYVDLKGHPSSGKTLKNDRGVIQERPSQVSDTECRGRDQVPVRHEPDQRERACGGF